MIFERTKGFGPSIKLQKKKGMSPIKIYQFFNLRKDKSPVKINQFLKKRVVYEKKSIFEFQKRISCP